MKVTYSAKTETASRVQEFPPLGSVEIRGDPARHPAGRPDVTEMIHLDTNYLIGLIGIESAIGNEVSRWLHAGEELAASAGAGAEFFVGPVTQAQIRNADNAIEKRIIPFGPVEAEYAAGLFRRGNRRHERNWTVRIAATAAVHGARLATKNTRDLKLFLSAGLEVV